MGIPDSRPKNGTNGIFLPEVRTQIRDICRVQKLRVGPTLGGWDPSGFGSDERKMGRLQIWRIYLGYLYLFLKFPRGGGGYVEDGIPGLFSVLHNHGDRWQVP